jgi:small nuclear ribonucleoprotein E
MNLILSDAEEVWLPKAATEKKAAREARRKTLGALSGEPGMPAGAHHRAGRLLLKGENITLLQPLA